jgi:hypothetical protein
MPSAAAKRYWDYLPNVCVCGAPSECVHHIIHVNGQRITKDDMLVVKLCSDCHQYGEHAVHRLGGERQFLEATGWNLVELAALRRHDFEARER